jgi:hypothetical protein
MFPRSVKGWKIFWVSIGAVVAAILFVLFWYPETPTFKRSALVAHSGATASKPVEIIARVSGNYVKPGEALDLVVDVTNVGTPALGTPELKVFAPRLDFEPPGPCVALTDASSKVTELATNHTCRFSVRLTANGTAGLDGITALASWNAGTRTTSLSLGPIRFESRFGDDKWARFGRRLTQISLPVILVLLASLFTYMQRERDEQITKEQKKREEEQEVRQAILARFMKLSDKCFLPLVTEAALILSESHDVREKVKGSSEDNIFFHMVMLLRKMDELRIRGGIFFKQRSGEAIAGACWSVLRRTIYGVLTDKGAQLAKDKLKLEDSQNITCFRREIATDTELATAFDSFKKWIAGDPAMADDYGKMEDYEGVLDVIRATFLYEANLPLSEHWYNEDSPFSLREEHEKEVSLPKHKGLNETQGKAIKRLQKKLPDYAEKNGKLKIKIV